MLGNEGGEAFAWSRVRVNIVRQALNIRILRPTGLIRHVEKRNGVGKSGGDERHPLVCQTPRLRSVIKVFSWSIERARYDPITSVLTRTFVAGRFTEVISGETILCCRRGCDVVAVNELDALPVSESMILRIEISTLIKNWLDRFI